MDEDGVHIETVDDSQQLENPSPEFIGRAFSTVSTSLQLYGWFILVGLIGIIIVWNKLKPWYYQWIRNMRERQAIERTDPEKAYQIQQSIESARRRMQEKVAADAERFKEKQKIIEEQKRQEKIENWENYQQGKGFKSKLAKRPEDSTSTEKRILKPKSTKPLRRPDYNPLTGTSSQSSNSSFRPSRRDVGRGG